MKSERVLVFERRLLTAIGWFQGHTRDAERYLNAIFTPGSAFFMDRGFAEGNADYKQLIPYVLLRFRGSIFAYQRGATSREVRLRGRLSIAIGGHIVENDMGEKLLTREAYHPAVRREVEEEVELSSPYDERIVGLINDESDEVGRVHFGVIHLWDLAEPSVKGREEQIVGGRFASLEEVEKNKGDLEGWSKIALEAVKEDASNLTVKKRPGPPTECE